MSGDATVAQIAQVIGVQAPTGKAGKAKVSPEKREELAQLLALDRPNVGEPLALNAAADETAPPEEWLCDPVSAISEAKDVIDAACASVSPLLPAGLLSAEADETPQAAARRYVAGYTPSTGEGHRMVRDEIAQQWQDWSDDGSSESAARAMALLAALPARSGDPTAIVAALLAVLGARRSAVGMATLREKMAKRDAGLMSLAARKNVVSQMRAVLVLDALAVLATEILPPSRRWLIPAHSRREVEDLHQREDEATADFWVRARELWRGAGLAGEPDGWRVLRAARPAYVGFLLANLRSIVETEATTPGSQQLAAGALLARLNRDEFLVTGDTLGMEQVVPARLLVAILTRSENRSRAQAFLCPTPIAEHPSPAKQKKPRTPFANPRAPTAAAAPTATPTANPPPGLGSVEPLPSGCLACGREGHRFRQCPNASDSQKRLAVIRRNEYLEARRSGNDQ